MVDSIVAGGARAGDQARSALDRGQELEEQAAVQGLVVVVDLVEGGVALLVGRRLGGGPDGAGGPGRQGGELLGQLLVVDVDGGRRRAVGQAGEGGGQVVDLGGRLGRRPRSSTAAASSPSSPGSS